MASNLDTAALRSFVAVAEAASMTAAANALHLTQGAVSQQIKRLELTLGCTLFERSRRGLRLTAEGERLFGGARRLLRLNDEIWSEMTTPAFGGEVRLGAPYDLVGTILPPLLKGFAQARPQVQISLTCLSSPQLVEALAAGRIDLALTEAQLGRAEGECLSVERLVWVGARGGSAFRKRPLPVSVVSETCAFRPAIFDALSGCGLEWRSLFENGSLDATAAMVRMDMAVTAWLVPTVPPDLDILGPEAGLPQLPGFAITLSLPRTTPAPAALDLARHLREGFLGRPRLAG